MIFREVSEQKAGRDNEPRWRAGVWLGFDLQSHQQIIGTSHGLKKASTNKSRPEEERWCARTLSTIRGSPWSPKARGKAAGPERSGHDAHAGARAAPEQPDHVEVSEPTESRPRAFRITKAILEAWHCRRMC